MTTALATFTENLTRQRREMEALRERRAQLSDELAASFVTELTGGKAKPRGDLERAIARIDADIERRAPALRQAETVRAQMAAADAVRELDALRPERKAYRDEWFVVANRLRTLLSQASVQSARLDELAGRDGGAREQERRALEAAGRSDGEVRPTLVNASVESLGRVLKQLDHDIATCLRDGE